MYTSQVSGLVSDHDILFETHYIRKLLCLIGSNRSARLPNTSATSWVNAMFQYTHTIPNMAPISPSRFSKYKGQRSKKQSWQWPDTSLFIRYTHDISSLWGLLSWGRLVPHSCFVAQSFLLAVEASWQCCYTNSCLRCATLGCCYVQRLQFTHTTWTRFSATSPTPLILTTHWYHHFPSLRTCMQTVSVMRLGSDTLPSSLIQIVTACPWASSGKQLTRTEKWLET